MAHKEQQDFILWVKNNYPSIFVKPKVFEVGSCNINGSLRSIVNNPSKYVGIDVGPGADVDLIIGGQDYDGPSGHFDIAISAECFEHNPYWLESFINMIRVCRSGGIVAFTCATIGREEHGTSRTSDIGLPSTTCWDYYKNLTADDFTSKINFDLHFSKWKFISVVDVYPQDLYFYGVKK